MKYTTALEQHLSMKLAAVPFKLNLVCKMVALLHFYSHLPLLFRDYCANKYSERNIICTVKCLFSNIYYEVAFAMYHKCIIDFVIVLECCAGQQNPKGHAGVIA